MMNDFKMLCLGRDNKIHCCDVSNTDYTSCKEVPVKQVNPDLGKLQSVGIELIWCYECSHLLEKQDEGWNHYE